MDIKPLPQMPILAQSVDKTTRNAFIDIHTRVNQLIQKTNGYKMAAQANSTATDIATLRADFNSLLAKLRDAGLLSK